MISEALKITIVSLYANDFAIFMLDVDKSSIKLKEMIDEVALIFGYTWSLSKSITVLYRQGQSA